MNPLERFQDTPSMVIMDNVLGLHWLPKDSYGDLGKWMNWQDVHGYIKTMNSVYAGGNCDWRLPTKEEALGLYHEEYDSIDFEEEPTHLHPVFVSKGSYNMWINEIDESGKALVLNLRDGSAEFSDKSEEEFMAARLVRKTAAPRS